jgi:regulator of replication initiation timing
MKSLHDRYEELLNESLTASIRIYNLQENVKHLHTENLELKLINTELELKLAKYELDISRKGV